MAVAGKVAITLSTENGGAWSADVTYDRLVAVKHNNNLYISRKTVANVEPPNNEFWFLALEGFGGDDVESILQAIENIINGTTQVGNAKTLDGHEAEYFAKETDLSNYLLKSGGTVEGNVTLYKNEASSILLYLVNLLRTVYQEVLADGTYTLYDKTNSKSIIISTADGTNTFNGTASGNLPLSGGKITGTHNNPLHVINTTDMQSFIRYDGIDGLMGYLGFNGKKVPSYSDGYNFYTLLHTGNKPTGTYTGNGSATARQISVGGNGINIYMRSSQGADMMVGYFGAHGVTVDGEPLHFTADEINFRGGIINVASDNAYLNGNGVINTYSLQ